MKANMDAIKLFFIMLFKALKEVPQFIIDNIAQQMEKKIDDIVMGSKWIEYRNEKWARGEDALDYQDWLLNEQG